MNHPDDFLRAEEFLYSKMLANTDYYEAKEILKEIRAVDKARAAALETSGAKTKKLPARGHGKDAK
jgi:hypothetical protein